MEHLNEHTFLVAAMVFFTLGKQIINIHIMHINYICICIIYSTYFISHSYSEVSIYLQLRQQVA